MSKLVKLFAAGVALSAISPAYAAPIFEAVPTDNYITFQGNDWAWAAPCAPSAPSCGPIDLSFQSTQGWRVAEAADFAFGPSAADFGTSSNFKCAAAWFSTTHTHCDYGDGESNAIFNNPLNPYLGNGAVETWVIRSVQAPVPEPGTWAMMIAGLGAVGFAMRRRRSVTVSFA